jgi:hypothetical protein
MPRAVTHCPQCGQRVTPFAAGCAVCGADLEAARAARSAKPRIELPPIRRFGIGGGSAGRFDWVHVAVAVVVALAIPPVGLLLALYWASRRHQDGEPAMTAVMLVVAALATAAIFAPQWFFSHLLNI